MTKEECEIGTSKAIMEMRSRIVELEKENAELDCQMNRNKYCYSCANVTDRCFRNEISCPCEKYKSYKDENAELKDKLEILIAVGNTCTKGLNKQLTKAKELIKELSSSLSVVGECEEEECELLNRAEQFLKDGE